MYFAGNFTSLTGIFRFKRKLGFYILQEFVPTILIVAVSWVGFWIDERSVPARVSLGITTVLAITTLLFGIQASLPRVGYVKAIDVFLFGSFVFVFAALVEYAIICTFPTVVSLRKGEKSKQKLFQTRMCSSLKIDLYSNGEVTSNGTFHGDYGHKQDNIQVPFVFLKTLRFILFIEPIFYNLYARLNFHFISLTFLWRRAILSS